MTQQTTTPANPPAFTFWLQPTYAPTTNPSKWLQECIDLSTLPPSTAHPTLLFYTQGPCSTHIASLISTSTSPSNRDMHLTSFFAPYISLLPNFSSSNPDCQPSAILATAWANDPFAGYGSYSNFQIGLEDGGKHIERMREGMPERGIWFAGEHCAPFVALGTTSGAWWSGERVGERILKAFEERE